MTELAWRSAALFRKAGQPDSAAQLLEKASLALGGDRQRDNSVLMLEKAVETVETENRPIQVGVLLLGIVGVEIACLLSLILTSRLSPPLRPPAT